MIKKRIKSFSYAFKGLWIALKNEPNARIHFAILILVVCFGLVLKISVAEWLVILLCFAIVISMELLNSALESLADAVTKEKNLLIKNAKDLAAGAVLWSSIISAIIGCIIFIPKILFFYS